jgi:DNA polymerase-3 subunit beta
MKFTATVKALKSILSGLMVLISNNDQLPILNNIFMKLEGNSLNLMTSDLDNYIIVETTVKGKSDGEICIPARLFNGIVNSFVSDITITLNDGIVNIKSDKAEFNIPTEDTDSYPRSFDIEDMKSMVLTDGNVKQLHKVLHSTATPQEVEEMMKPEFSAVYFNATDENLTFAATNSYKLTETKHLLTAGQKTDNISLLLSNKFANLICKYGKEKEKSFELSYNDKFVKAEIGSMLIISKIVTEQYPAYQSVIPKDFNSIFTVKKDVLMTAIKRASLVNPKVTEFKFNEQTLTITGNLPDANMTYSSNVPFTSVSENAPAEFKINAEYLQDAIAETDPEKEEITINVANKNILISGKAGQIELIMFKNKPEQKKKDKKEKETAETKTAETTATEPKPKATKKTKETKKAA